MISKKYLELLRTKQRVSIHFILDINLMFCSPDALGQWILSITVISNTFLQNTQGAAPLSCSRVPVTPSCRYAASLPCIREGKIGCKSGTEPDSLPLCRGRAGDGVFKHLEGVTLHFRVFATLHTLSFDGFVFRYAKYETTSTATTSLFSPRRVYSVLRSKCPMHSLRLSR